MGVVAVCIRVLVCITATKAAKTRSVIITIHALSSCLFLRSTYAERGAFRLEQYSLLLCVPVGIVQLAVVRSEPML